jgi:hypothetical protein
MKSEVPPPPEPVSTMLRSGFAESTICGNPEILENEIAAETSTDKNI